MAVAGALWMRMVLLGAVGLLQTPAQAQVPVQPNFQQDKFLGRWFSAGLASNSTWFQEKKALIFMCTSNLGLTADGSLNITATFVRNDQCETRTMVLTPVGPAGHYSYRSPHWASEHDVRVVETDYDQYALLYSEGTKGPGHDFRMATFYSRTQNPKAEFKEKFSTFAKAQGFTEDTIVFLPKTDKCMESSK